MRHPTRRSNQAGELGAVWIYRGAAWALRYRWLPPVRHTAALAFVSAHMKTEQGHLSVMDALTAEPRHPASHIMPRRRTHLDPLWRVAGWLLGAVPCLVGGDLALYRTVAHVERFVQTHYDEQIAWLAHEIERGADEKRLNAPTADIWLSSSTDRDSMKELLILLRSFCADETEHRLDAESRAPPLPTGAGALLDSLWGRVVGAGSVAAVQASKWI